MAVGYIEILRTRETRSGNARSGFLAYAKNSLVEEADIRSSRLRSEEEPRRPLNAEDILLALIIAA